MKKYFNLIKLFKNLPLILLELLHIQDCSLAMYHHINFLVKPIRF